MPAQTVDHTNRPHASPSSVTAFVPTRGRVADPPWRDVFDAPPLSELAAAGLLYIGGGNSESNASVRSIQPEAETTGRQTGVPVSDRRPLWLLRPSRPEPIARAAFNDSDMAAPRVRRQRSRESCRRSVDSMSSSMVRPAPHWRYCQSAESPSEAAPSRSRAAVQRAPRKKRRAAFNVLVARNSRLAKEALSELGPEDDRKY